MSAFNLRASGAMKADLSDKEATVAALKTKLATKRKALTARCGAIRERLVSFGIEVPASAGSEHLEASLEELQGFVGRQREIAVERAREQVAACGFAPPPE